MENLEKNYNPKDIEERIYKQLKDTGLKFEWIR